MGVISSLQTSVSTDLLCLLPFHSTTLVHWHWWYESSAWNIYQQQWKRPMSTRNELDICSAQYRVSSKGDHSHRQAESMILLEYFFCKFSTMFEQFASQIRRLSYVFVLSSECTGKMSSNHIHKIILLWNCTWVDDMKKPERLGV